MDRCMLSLLVLTCVAVGLIHGQAVGGPPPYRHPEVLTYRNPPPAPVPRPRGDRKDVPDNFRRAQAPPAFTPLGQVGAPPPTFIRSGPPPPRRSKDVPDNFRRRPPTMTKSGPPPPRRFGAPPPVGYIPPSRFVPIQQAPPVFPPAPLFPDIFFPPQPTAYPTEPPRYFEKPKEEEEESKS